MADISNIASRIGLPDHMKIRRTAPDQLNVVLDDYTVLVNPSSYKVSYGVCHENDQYVGATTSHYQFSRAIGQQMNVDLLFDNTGSLGKLPFGNEIPVLDQVERFLEVAYAGKPVDNQGEEIKNILIVWGPMSFYGVLSSVNIEYTHFDHTGQPIRAKASCSFSGGEVFFDKTAKAKKIEKRKAKDKKIVDFNKEKHAINAVMKYSHYMVVVSQQPKTAMPKSLRIAEEVAKLIIK